MTILAVDTSCDETSVSLLVDRQIINQQIFSQVDLQQRWGGVVPMLAKRKHLERMEYCIVKCLVDSASALNWDQSLMARYQEVLAGLQLQLNAHEAQGLIEAEQTNNSKSYQEPVQFHGQKIQLRRLLKLANPGVELLAVTTGPGLAVALEVGIGAVEQMANAWQLPVSVVNHMEGHFWSGWQKSVQPQQADYPILGLLVSGGHTELVLAAGFANYTILGQKLDDAAGEAFDKFAVMLGLGYPGGAQVEAQAAKLVSYAGSPGLEQEALASFPLPIPMQHSGDYNFSYSGLKTAALYLKQKYNFHKPEDISELQLAQFCYSFQNSVVKSLEIKLVKALREYRPKILVTGGGVITNNAVRKMLTLQAERADIPLLVPERSLWSDNASMIGIVAWLNNLHSRNIFTTTQLQQRPELLERLPNLAIDAMPAIIN